MAERDNVTNTGLKRVIDMRWCVDYLILGGVSVMRAPKRLLPGSWIRLDAKHAKLPVKIQVTF